MFKLLAIIFAALCIMAVSTPVFAAEQASGPAAEDKAASETQPEMPGNPINKFSRGLCNLVTFPLEIMEQSKRVRAEYGSVAGMTYGFGRGFLMAGVRAVVGVYEVATFLIPYPAGYKPILTDPVSLFPQPPKRTE